MRLLRPRSRVPIGLLPTTNKFDEATGQVYTETIVAIQRSDDRNWVHWLYRQCVFRLQPTASGDQIDEISQGDSTQVGGRSLKETAILCILRNIVDLKLEMIEDLPITVKYQLWDAIKKRNAVSLDTWKIFSQALRHHRSEPDLFDFSCAIKQPKSLLQVYTGPLNSKRCQFVTSLSISMDVSISDLAKLPELSNIIVLEIVCPDASQNQFSVGDRLVRDWHSAVLNDGAFPVLRFLRFWGFEEVTDRSLSYIGAFPALAVFDVGRCSITHESPTPSGWTQIRGDNPSRFLANACSERNRHLYNQKTGAHAYKQGIEILSYESAELESHQPTPRAMPNQSDNQSGMRFIPRGDMPSFMNQPAPAAWLRKEGIYESGMKVDTWGKTTYKLSPLVGDIRHDADLARAGYNIQDQAVIGNALINSVPLISIRLGSKYTISSTCSRISYIRTQVLYPLNIRTPPAHGHNGVKDDTGSTGFSSANVDSHERGLMGSRKRKLNDLLDSFI